MLAEFLGYRDTRMIDLVYGHLSRRTGRRFDSV
jgi:hypothetical protein